MDPTHRSLLFKNIKLCAIIISIGVSFVDFKKMELNTFAQENNFKKYNVECSFHC